MIRQILFLRHDGKNKTEISVECKCARGTVISVCNTFDDAEITYEETIKMSDEVILRSVYPTNEDKGVLSLNAPNYLEDFSKIEYIPGQKLNLKREYEKYCQRIDKPVTYMRYCQLFHKYLKSSDLANWQRYPGEVIYTGWASKAVNSIVKYPIGKAHSAKLFLAVCGYSGKFFAKAYPDDDTINNWIEAHKDTISFYDAIPLIIQTNNRRIILAEDEENKDFIKIFDDWAADNEIKISVEDIQLTTFNLSYFEKIISESLFEKQFSSFFELNKFLLNIVDKLNSSPYTNQSDNNRNSFFDKYDLTNMRCIPKTVKEQRVESKLKVGYDFHVIFQETSYSVPWRHYGEEINAVGTGTTLEIFTNEWKLICVHNRNFDSRRKYVTAPKNMPPAGEYCEWNGSRIINYALNEIGYKTSDVVSKILAAHPIEQQAYNECMNIIHLKPHYAAFKIEAASKKALEQNSCSYRSVVNILKREEILNKGKLIGTHALAYFKNILNCYIVDEQAYSECFNIVNLQKQFTNSEIDAACEKAEMLTNCSPVTKYSFRQIQETIIEF